MERNSYNKYLGCCNNCLKDNTLFNEFKSRHEYRVILEHVTPQIGKAYIKVLEEKYSEYIPLLDWSKFEENDKIGNPLKHNFTELKKYTENTKFSPTTIRYIVTGLDILYNYKMKNSKKELNIVEVGGGYGGQCKLIFDLAPLFDLEVKSYTIMDYDIVCNLQKKYLSTLGYKNVNFLHFDLKNVPKLNKYDLFISNYALGEISKKYQNYYVNYVVKYARNLYIIWNMTPLHEYFKTDKFVKTTENPQTGKKNVVIMNKENIF